MLIERKVSVPSSLFLLPNGFEDDDILANPETKELMLPTYRL